MVYELAELIFRDEFYKYKNTLEKLEDKAKKINLDIPTFYFYGLEGMKYIIKNKSSLKKIGEKLIDLAKEAIDNGLDLRVLFINLRNCRDNIKNNSDLEKFGKMWINSLKERNIFNYARNL